MLFDYQLNASYLINDCLKNNKIFILSGENGIGKKYIINHIESDYNIFPIIENVYSVKDFLSQIIVFKNYSNQMEFELGVGQAFQVNVPVSQIIDKFSSFIKSDFNNLENKVINEINSLAKNNNFLLPIQLYKNTSERLVNFLCNEITKLDIRIILIIDSEDINTLKYKGRLPDIPSVIVECKKENLYTEFNKYLSNTDIDQILKITSGKTKYIIELYKYLSLHPFSDYIEYTKLKFSNIKEENPDAYVLLEFLSYFESQFSINEIKYIYNKLYSDLKVYSSLNALVKYVLENNILKEDNSVYSFILSLFQQILRQNDKKQERFYLTLGKCVAELYPLDLNMQLFFYSKTEDKYTNIIRLLMCVRLARNQNTLVDTNEVLETIGDDTIKQIAITICKAYKCYYNCEYDNGIQLLSTIKISENSTITNEANYLLAICYWKKSSEYKLESYRILECIVDDSNTFEETIILAKMALLSIYANDAQYHQKNKLRLYNELKNYVLERMKDDKDYELLLGILRRKSNTVYPMVQCLSELENSYSYFLNNRYLFSEEFAMSLCNFSAALLSLGNFNKSVECYRNVKWETLHHSFKLYNFNNYILSLFFMNDNVIDERLMKLIKEFEELIKHCNTSTDTRILTYINLAGLMVYEGKYDKAIKLYQSAAKLNDNYDDYFIYFINTNLSVIDIINNDYLNAEKHHNECNFVPEIFSTYERQYIKSRNKILADIIKTRKSNITLEIISKKLSKGLNNAFITNNTSFFRSGVLFSDIQFWTDN